MNGGCFGTNCIDVAVVATSALDSCGANNLNGAASGRTSPTGVCSGNGIGEIVRSFRIGTVQGMNGDGATWPTAGSVFDDGFDASNNSSNAGAGFTCNIVATKIIQCVKGSGQWSSGLTFISYGDATMTASRESTILGYVGGQSFPFVAGSGMTPNSTITETASCGTGTAPKFDVTVSGGSIVSVVPSSVAGSPGLNIVATCTVPMTGFSGGTVGSVNVIPLNPVEGTGGVGTYNTDNNTMGMFLYDSSGKPGGPLNQFFGNGMGGYWEPGLPVRPFGQWQALGVSG